MSHVTVIIPAYNPGQYLEEAVNSVLSQTFEDWDLLVIDDGSTQRWDWSPHDPRIRLIHKDNGGPASARNVGLDQASGDLIAFLDSDDTWAPTKLARQVTAMDTDHHMGMSSTQFRHIDGDGTTGEIGYGRPQSRTDLLKTGDGICTSSVMIRRGPVRFDPVLAQAEDFDMWLRLSTDLPGGFVDSEETLYRTHGANMTGNYRQTWKGIQTVYAAHPGPNSAEGLKRYRIVFANQAWNAARTARRREAPRHILAAAMISPSTAARLAWSTVKGRWPR
jgi:glycosyltransferase involved in cell wall biosynthesis